MLSQTKLNVLEKGFIGRGYIKRLRNGEAHDKRGM